MAAALAASSAGCANDDGGSFCCRCTCCDAVATLERSDQTWPNCDDPCRKTCAEELGCNQMVELAESCDPAE